MKLIIATLTLMVSLSAFSSIDSVDDTYEATGVALEDFKKKDASITDKFNGFKGWPVTGGVKVKVYLNDGTNIAYSCHRHAANDPYECHQTN